MKVFFFIYSFYLFWLNRDLEFKIDYGVGWFTCGGFFLSFDVGYL